MSTLIVRTAARVLMPLLLLFAVFLLLRGHNSPGGGFVGGLVVAAAFVLHVFAFGLERTRAALLVDPATLFKIGLLVAFVSGLQAWIGGDAFLTARWAASAPVGTPHLFDVGVFLVVIGVVLTMVFTLVEG